MRELKLCLNDCDVMGFVIENKIKQFLIAIAKNMNSS